MISPKQNLLKKMIKYNSQTDKLLKDISARLKFWQVKLLLLG